MGKSLYLSDEQIDLLKSMLAAGNFSCVSDDEESEIRTFEIRDQIIKKLFK